MTTLPVTIFARRPLLVAAVAASLMLPTSGCTRIRAHQGFIAETTLIDAIAVGVDNKESVERTLGRPTFTGQFDAQEYYYVSRTTKQLAFSNPRPDKQTVLQVKFDPSGRVAAVNRLGMEQVVALRPNGDVTPTLGKDRGLLEEIFGNIGAVGAAGAGGGAGQPQ